MEGAWANVTATRARLRSRGGLLSLCLGPHSMPNTGARTISSIIPEFRVPSLWFKYSMPQHPTQVIEAPLYTCESLALPWLLLLTSGGHKPRA